MGVAFSDTIDRMRWAGNLKNDSAVARVLDITPQALSNYKKRGHLPTDLVLKFADIFGLSMDWLISGEGEMYRRGVEPKKPGAMAYLKAAEETSQFTAGDGKPLTPDEIIYLGKLLKVLRGRKAGSSSAIKQTIDAVLQTLRDAEEEDTGQLTA